VTVTYTIPVPVGSVNMESVVVPAIVHNGGPFRTVPELLFEKKRLIPDLRQLILSYPEKET